MPKPKRFDIGTFVEESSENVVPLRKSSTEAQATDPNPASQVTQNAPQPTSFVQPEQPGIYPPQPQPAYTSQQQGSYTSQQQNGYSGQQQMSYAAQQQNVYAGAQQSVNSAPQQQAYVPQTQNFYNAQQTMTQGQAMQQSQPTIQNQQVMPLSMQDASEPITKNQRGRKKSLRTIPRQNGKVVFLEVEADTALARISVLQRVDKQDIIRTALDEFLKSHFDGNNLDASGALMLTEYIKKTTQSEI